MNFTPFGSVAALCAVLGAMPAQACLWDRDTLAQEASGRLDVVHTAVGAFDRNPPRYYEMRAERLSAELTRQPQAAEATLYDDLAVALDQLGRSSEAIDLMQKKAAAVERMTAPAARAEQEYRRLANLGTFHAHRWFRAPDRAAALEDLQEALRVLRAAIALNPDAHFGREKYQIMVLAWLLRGYEEPLRVERRSRGESSTDFSRSFIDRPTAGEDPDHVIRGLCGLVQLGSAWESIDVFRALEFTTNSARVAHLSQMVTLRIAELAKAGIRSAHPYCETLARPENAELLWRVELKSFLEPSPDDAIRNLEFFQRARAISETNAAARTKFMEDRFRQGMHPDTHPDFLDGGPRGLPAAPTPRTRSHSQAIVRDRRRPHYAHLRLGDRRSAARRFGETYLAPPPKGLARNCVTERVDRLGR